MWPTTYELFEFNKMWLVFIMSIIIAFLWGAKMIIQKKFELRRTPLDIPIALFLISQIISTIISMDPHVSIWGYYSRFNGGLLSTISYIFLYYAFATNFIHSEGDSNDKSVVSSQPAPLREARSGLSVVSFKLLFVSLLSGLAVTLWGLPSHFGMDPTCLVFRGTFDVSCWTDAFQPTIRIFSTLGQPNWMGTYLAALIPIAIGFGFYKLSEKKYLISIYYLLITFLFFISILFTRSQSSFLGLIIGMLFFIGLVIYKNLNSIREFGRNDFSKYFIGVSLVFIFTNFFIGDPIYAINKFTSLSGLSSFANKPVINAPVKKPAAATAGGLENTTDINLGGTESSDIRLIVWKGAIETFKRNPLFGTGVETFAYSYYAVKPLAHNLTSEWDYLYNKAHNEYLNYLSTTGIFGLGSYLLMASLFIFLVVRRAVSKSHSEYFPISAGIAGGYISMLVANFFGFSVVVINLFIFTFPIFYFALEYGSSLKKTFNFPKNAQSTPYARVAPPSMILVVVLLLVALYYEVFLINFWSADKKYALGYNLDHASEYAQGFQPLMDAVKALPSEDLYKDELSINMATISLLLAEQKEATQSAQFGSQAKALSDEVIAKHPNNIVYLKTRARVAFALSEIDPSMMDLAIQTVEQARKLAPTDAKLAYNQGLFYQQKGDMEKAVQYVKEAINLKPNYGDAYYSLALMYGDLAKQNPRQAQELSAKEKESLEYLLQHIDPNNKGAKDLLKTL